MLLEGVLAEVEEPNRSFLADARLSTCELVYAQNIIVSCI
jgi:hypothetical protein